MTARTTEAERRLSRRAARAAGPSRKAPGRVARTGWALALLALVSQTPHADVTQDLPVLGDAASRLISPELEKEIGRDFLKQVHAALPTIRDPILKYYVETQIGELAQYSELRDTPLNVVLIDEEAINAFAAPGGVVGINLGLMLHAQDVHEYASVIAHELAHLSQRHFARGIEEQQANALPTVASLIAAIAVGIMGGSDAGVAAISAAQAASISNQLSYSRTREQEADRIGLNTLVQAGLDPSGMSRMFERMSRAYRFTRTPPEFLLTHPLSESRVSDARNQAARYPQRRYEDSPDYALMRTRAMVHFADSPRAAVQRFEDEVRDHPESDVARYGLALALSRAGDHGDAIALADALFTDEPDKILYVSAYAEFLIEAGRLAQAKTLLEKKLAIYPGNSPLTMLYARALTRNQEYQAAEAVLEKQSLKRSNDIDVWYDLAEVSGKAGDIIGVHRARAEFFALHGAYQRAIQHLEYARRLVSRSDERLLARLEQRLTELRTALRVARS